MSTVNPSQILQAFDPLLTEKGGIKPADQTQFKKICNLMKSYSTKLVSKCIYYQILMATSPDVLEKFLKIGGWDLICLWMKSSRDLGNVTYLIDLLKLLHMLPMNIDRLRENECPKIVKKLCKHENEEIAMNANLIFKKWKNIIETFSGKNSDSSNNNSGGQMTKDKKRKSSNDNSSEYKNDQKKQKLSAISSSNNSIGPNDSKTSTMDAELSNMESKQTSSGLPKEANQEKSITKRPVTAKVKQGKFRLILSSPAIKSSDNNKIVKKITIKAIDDNHNNKSNALKNDLENNSLKMNAKTSSTNGNNKNVLKDSISFMDALSMMPVVGNKKRRKLPMNNHNNNNNNNNNHNSNNNININNISNDINNKDIDSKSGTNNETNKKLNKTTSSSSTTATENNDTNLVANESQSLVKNELSDSNLVLSNNDDNNSSVEDSRNKKMIQFYTEYTDSLVEESKDCNNEINSSSSSGSNVDEDNCQIVDIKLESNDICEINGSTNSSKNNNEDNNNDSKLSINNDSQTVNSGDGCNQPKSILCIIKKNSKKSVRWLDDDKLKQIKYFELDETERINVTRPTDMKRCDMKHEAQMMNDSKKGRCLSFGPWKLIPIDPLLSLQIERGKFSNEKLIQAERMQTTLECFYFNDQIPDNPEEPENYFEFNNEEKIVIIPLEDENAIDRYASMNPNPIESNNFIPNMPFDAVNFNNNRDNFYPFNSAPPTTNPNYAPQSVPPPMNAAGPSSLPFAPPVSAANNVNYLSQTAPPSVPNNFDSCNSANYPMYNNYSNSAVNNQPQQVGTLPPPPGPPFPNQGDPSNVPPYQDFNSNTNNYGPAFSGADNGINQNPPVPATNMYPMPNQNNYFNGNNLPPPVNQSAGNENYTNYWPENNSNNNNNVNNNANNNYPPPPAFQSQPPQGGNGQKFRGRGNGPRGRGPFKNNNTEVCRFFFKHGKCKFDNRCNYSHVLDNQKASNRF